MSKNDHEHHEMNNQNNKEMDTDKGIDSFASLNKALVENPEFKKTYESILSILTDDESSSDDDIVDCYEIDGHDYIVAGRYEIKGNTYLYLCNIDNVLDFIIQKSIQKDGEEYLTGLDSEKEFELVQAHLQRDLLIKLKAKLKAAKENKPDDE